MTPPSSITLQCPLVCTKCWPKYGPSLVKINHRGGPLIATPLNFNIKIKVLWPVGRHHLLLDLKDGLSL